MGGEVATAYCVIAYDSFTPPSNCPPGDVSDGFYLQQGGAASPQCRSVSDGFFDRPRPTLDFEQT